LRPEHLSRNMETLISSCGCVKTAEIYSIKGKYENVTPSRVAEVDDSLISFEDFYQHA
jgi:hypothetical protein